MGNGIFVIPRMRTAVCLLIQGTTPKLLSKSRSGQLLATSTSCFWLPARRTMSLPSSMSFCCTFCCASCTGTLLMYRPFDATSCFAAAFCHADSESLSIPMVKGHSTYNSRRQAGTSRPASRLGYPSALTVRRIADEDRP